MKAMPRALDFAASLPLSDYNDARVLSASTAETVSVPADAQYALLTTKSGVDIWINSKGAAAAVPSGDVTDGSASQLVLTPQMVKVTPKGTLSVISEVVTTLSIAWFSQP